MELERLIKLWNAAPTGVIAPDAVTPLKGVQAHEVAVGPVHAGVIEPGHFRFQCLGEDVKYLEIALGYQHRGAERMLVEASSNARRLAIAQTIAGDTSVAAGIAASAALGIDSPYGEQGALLLELERIANHVGDLGALAGDVAYLPTASFCGRIRGEYLNMTAEIVGNRFGRALVAVPKPDEAKRAKLVEWFHRTEREAFHAIGLLFSEESAVTRFEGTGTVTKALAEELGMVGVAARASGVEGTIGGWPVVGGGDVLARAKQRYEELKIAHQRVSRWLNGEQMPKSIVSVEERQDDGGFYRAASVDAWRGELVHVAKYDQDRRLTDYRVFDPSFFNWCGLAHALRGEQISNFPICNKSFNLSYCGVDR